MDKELMDLLADENEGRKDNTSTEEVSDDNERSEEASQETEAAASEGEEAKGKGEDETSIDEDIKLTKTEYQKLISEISELKAKIKPEPKEEVREQEPEDKDVDYIGQDRLDDILSDPSRVNALLNKIRRTAREEGVTKARENILRSLPEVVRSSVSRFTALREMVSDFYVENPDLKAHKQFVGLVANEVASTNPDKINQPNGVKWIFKEAAREARKRLKLKPAEGKSAGTSKTLPGGTKGSSRGGTPKVEKKGVAKEIDDMLSTLQ